MLPDRFLSCSPHDTVPPSLSYSLSGVGGMNLGIKNPRQLIGEGSVWESVLLTLCTISVTISGTVSYTVSGKSSLFWRVEPTRLALDTRQRRHVAVRPFSQRRGGGYPRNRSTDVRCLLVVQLVLIPLLDNRLPRARRNKAIRGDNTPVRWQWIPYPLHRPRGSVRRVFRVAILLA